MTQGEELLRDWAADPLLFALDCWPELELREWQRTFLDRLAKPRNRRAALLCPRDGGKSFVAALAALHHLCTKPGSLTLLIAPISRQTEQGVMLEVSALWRKSEVLRGLFPSWRLLSDGIETDDPQWRLLATATDKPERLEAPHSPGPPLVVIDEARGLPDQFLKSLEGVLAHPGSRLIAASVAGPPRGFFYDAFHGNHGGWDLAFEVPLSSVPHVEKHYRDLVKRYGEGDALLRQQYLNIFADVAEWSLFSPELLEPCRGLDPDSRDWRPWSPAPIRRMGWDVAQHRDDSILCYLTGRRVERFERLPAGDLMLQVSIVVQRLNEFCPETAAVDTVGLGAGCYSRLSEILRPYNHVRAVGFNASATANNSERYFNRKTELVLALHGALQEKSFGLPAPGDPMGDRLSRELSSLTLTETTRGAVRIVDPKVSPDVADSLICALSTVDSAPFSSPLYRPCSPAWL